MFDAFLSCWNQFRRKDLDSDDKFGSKKLVESQFAHDICQNFTSGQLHPPSLVELLKNITIEVIFSLVTLASKGVK